MYFGNFLNFIKYAPSYDEENTDQILTDILNEMRIIQINFMPPHVQLQKWLNEDYIKNRIPHTERKYFVSDEPDEKIDRHINKIDKIKYPQLIHPLGYEYNPIEHIYEVPDTNVLIKPHTYAQRIPFTKIRSKEFNINNDKEFLNAINIFIRSRQYDIYDYSQFTKYYEFTYKDNEGTEKKLYLNIPELYAMVIPFPNLRVRNREIHKSCEEIFDSLLNRKFQVKRQDIEGYANHLKYSIIDFVNKQNKIVKKYSSDNLIKRFINLSSNFDTTKIIKNKLLDRNIIIQYFIKDTYFRNHMARYHKYNSSNILGQYTIINLIKSIFLNDTSFFNYLYYSNDVPIFDILYNYTRLNNEFYDIDKKQKESINPSIGIFIKKIFPDYSEKTKFKIKREQYNYFKNNKENSFRMSYSYNRGMRKYRRRRNRNKKIKPIYFDMNIHKRIIKVYPYISRGGFFVLDRDVLEKFVVNCNYVIVKSRFVINFSDRHNICSLLKFLISDRPMKYINALSNENANKNQEKNKRNQDKRDENKRDENKRDENKYKNPSQIEIYSTSSIVFDEQVTKINIEKCLFNVHPPDMNIFDGPTDKYLEIEKNIIENDDKVTQNANSNVPHILASNEENTILNDTYSIRRAIKNMKSLIKKYRKS